MTANNALKFVTLASFSWDCTPKITKMDLKILTDVNMILEYKISVGGGITRAIFHYGEANNKYIHGYVETKEST